MSASDLAGGTVSHPLILLGLAILLVFLLGLLVGTGLTTRVQDTRDRRQAARQRELNDQAQALREQRHVWQVYESAKRNRAGKTEDLKKGTKDI